MAAKWEGGVSRPYKTPVIKTAEDEAFYSWLNEHTNKNKLITRALKTLWKLETRLVSDEDSLKAKYQTGSRTSHKEPDFHKADNMPESPTGKETITRVRLPSGSALKKLSKLSGT